MDKKPNATTTDIWILLNVAHKRVTQKFETELKRAGLPPAGWYDILWGLERSPDGLRQFELERKSLFDQPNLSRTLKRMAEEGLVRQSPAPQDRRGRVLTITEQGKALRLKMWDVYGGLMKSEIESKVPADLTDGLIQGLSALAPEFERNDH
ncbi:MarR family winged helix-turn-helix transcriptional regulator [uncultured Aliiroseovarius sp.]|uniref:MarR family winged helix-turn-helix transcriptional regulator n=1 Tax=uncultured Aliiroseovarius sp. TaxID=1658783 RepID=UPI00263A0E41|nr:MarR family winged helix-turn-helix transcriptional regulator [uncultured Aliiroseovarius sp.]